MEKRGLKKWELALMAAFCFTLCFSVRTQAQRERLTEGIVRLHVIAQSDSDYEQDLKMRVQQRVVGLIEPALKGCSSTEQAIARLEGMLPELEAAALSASEGRTVSVQLGKQQYGLREAEGYTLPAGEYNSLQVRIGSAQGRNWWGVIFPQLTPDGGDYVDAASIIGEDNVRLITEREGYVVKLRVLEWLKELFY